MDLNKALIWIEQQELINEYNSYTIKRYGKKELNSGEIFTSVLSFIIQSWENKNSFLSAQLQKQCLSYEHYKDEILEAIESEIKGD